MGVIETLKYPSWKKVGEIIVSSPTTSVSFTGLNISKDDDYMLVSDIYNSSASYYDYNLYVNGNTVATNYYYEWLLSNGTSVTSGRINSSAPFGANATSRGFSLSRLKLTNSGYFTYQTNETRMVGTSSLHDVPTVGTSTFTMSLITSLSIVCASSAIGVGSRFTLYKCIAPKVADITVTGSAVTSVDIGSLNIGKGSEYMLVSDFYNPQSKLSNIYLTANANETLTNYYSQYIECAGVNKYAARNNDAVIAWSSVTFNTLAITSIKLTNSGYFVAQSNTMFSHQNTLPELLNHYTTSTFTSTSITSMKVTGSVASSIGIGSRFQLYQMK